MIPGLYSAATAMNVADKRHDVVAQNLAHLNMPGYRRMVTRQQTFEASMDAAQRQKYVFDSLGTNLTQTGYDFSPGNYARTDRKLDFALHGEGFFTIQAEGQEMYTRNGTFHTDQNGRLITSDGYPVVGETGDIVVPPEISPSMITVARDGSVQVGEQVLGKMKLVNFSNPQRLEKRGVTLFVAPPGVEPEASTAMVFQGERELSNVAAVSELIELIAINKSHDAAQRAMDTINESIQQRIDLQGR